MVIAVLPGGTTVEQIARVEGMSPGVVSAGLGDVPLIQTYLDIGQGNRVNKHLYDPEVPPSVQVRDGRVHPPQWSEVVDRAEGAPADIVPGLLASTLEEGGVPVTAEDDAGLATLIAVDREGGVRVVPPEECRSGCGPGLSVVSVSPSELAAVAERLGPQDLLIAMAAGANTDQRLFPAGAFGARFDGDLTSDSTRTDGIVTSTDIAPTVLDRFGLGVPEEMNGSEIEATGEPDPESVAHLQTRLADRPSRDLVLLLPLAVWTTACALASLAAGARGARAALPLLALACAWAPLMLLLAAAVDADEATSALINGLGSVALAIGTRALVPGYRGLAVACAATVVAHAADVIAGSPYTSFSVLGPNPGGGVRFFGIGNELEAALTTLTIIGAGAWLATRPRLNRAAAAASFALIALAAAAAFAPGGFGADVGAAIVLAVGGGTAAVLALGYGWRRATVTVGAGVVLGLVALVGVDLISGGAHLSRSVLGAGEASDVVDVLDRRVNLMANTFVHPPYPLPLGVCGAVLVLGLWRRRTVLSWFGDRWPARCGYVGALTGVLVGTVANDSGSVLLVIGTIYLAVCSGFFWAERGEPRPTAASPMGVRANPEPSGSG